MFITLKIVHNICHSSWYYYYVWLFIS